MVIQHILLRLIKKEFGSDYRLVWICINPKGPKKACDIFVQPLDLTKNINKSYNISCVSPTFILDHVITVASIDDQSTKWTVRLYNQFTRM